MELHLIKSVIDIERINISIRFPGQLSCLLRNNQLYQDLPKLYPLTNGQCFIKDSVTFQLESTYKLSNNSYDEVIVDLIISINTASGKIIAGVVSFNILQNTTATFPLKRCSDKNATVTLHISYLKVHKIKDLQLTKVKSLIINTSSSKPPQKYTSLSSIKSTDNLATVSRSKSPVMATLQNQQQIERLRRISKGSQKGSIKNKLVTTRQNDMGRGIDPTLKQMEENYDNKLKIIKLEKDQLEFYLEKTKEKCKIAERRERELHTINKQITELSDKRKTKIADLQAKLNELQKSQAENDKKIKILQSDLKAASQNQDQLSTKYITLQRKLQSKQQTMNERQKRLQLKLLQLQSSNTKAIHQYNNLLEKMNSQEKANQTANKLKDKFYLEEKVKLREQVDRLHKQLLKYTQINEQITLKSVNLSSQSKISFSKYSQVEAEVQLLRSNIHSKQIQLQGYIRVEKQMKQQIKNLLKVQEQHSVLKKKITQSHQQNHNLKEKINKLVPAVTQLKQHEDSLSSSLEQLKKQKKEFIITCSELEKTLAQFNSDNTKLKSQNNNLSSHLNHLNGRINDLTAKIQQLNQSIYEKEAVFVNRYNSLLQINQYLKSDLEDYKWSVQREKEKTFQAEKIIRQRSDDVLRHEEQSLKLRKQLQNCLGIIRQNSLQKANLQQQVSELNSKEKQYLRTIQDKENLIYQASKKISSIQQQSFISSSNLKNTLSQTKKITANYEDTLESLKRQLQQRNNYALSLQSKCKQLQEQLQKQFMEQQMLNSSFNQSLQTSKENQQAKLLFKQRSDFLKRQLEQLQQKSYEEQQRYVQQILQLRHQANIIQRQTAQYQKELQTYKKAIQQLIIIISKSEEHTNQIQVIGLPSESISKAQLQALAARNTYLSNLKGINLQMQAQIDCLQSELHQKSNLIDVVNQERQQFAGQKNKYITDMLKKHSQQKISLEQQLQTLSSELLNQKNQRQRVQNKYISLCEQYQQLKEQWDQLKQKYQRNCQELKNLQERILTLRKSIMDSRSEKDVALYSIKSQNQQEIQTYKQKINQLITNEELLLKNVGLKEKQISYLKGQLVHLEGQKQIKKQQLDALTQKHKNQTQEKYKADQSLKESQKSIKNLRYCLQKAEIQAKGQRQLKVHAEQKLKEVYQQLSDLLVANQMLQSRLQETDKAFVGSSQEQKHKIIRLQYSLENQIIKTSNLFNQMAQKNNELELYQFQTSQLLEKIATSDSLSGKLHKENQQKRTEIIRLTSKIQDLDRFIMEQQKHKEEYSEQQFYIEEELALIKQTIKDLEVTIESLNQNAERLNTQLDYINKKYEAEKQQKNGLVTSSSQLRVAMAEMKKEIQRLTTLQNEAKTRISNLQSNLQEKQQLCQVLKNKNSQQSQHQLAKQRQICLQLENRIKILQQERQSERTDFHGQLQMINQENIQLQQIMEQKEDIIEQYSAEIVDLQHRIIDLNEELKKCLQAWQNQKAATLQSSKQVQEVGQSMDKFLQYANQLDKKTQQILSISTFMIKDEIINKSSVSLLQLIEMINDSKSRVVSKVALSDKYNIAKQYDSMREKVQKVLKSQRTISSQSS